MDMQLSLFQPVRRNIATYRRRELIGNVGLHAVKLFGKFWRRNDACVRMFWICMPHWAVRTMLHIKQVKIS